MNQAIPISSELAIPRSELELRVSRSSGPGGQHVNKTSSRIEIIWSVATSPSLTDNQRERLLKKLASRLSADGTIRVVASDTRSQLRNRERAEERLADIVRRGLLVAKKRKPTRRPRAANEARLKAKKKLSDKKRERKSRPAE